MEWRDSRAGCASCDNIPSWGVCVAHSSGCRTRAEITPDQKRKEAFALSRVGPALLFSMASGRLHAPASGVGRQSVGGGDSPPPEPRVLSSFRLSPVGDHGEVGAGGDHLEGAGGGEHPACEGDESGASHSDSKGSRRSLRGAFGIEGGRFPCRDGKTSALEAEKKME